jgi:hypothetical protein
MWREQRTGDDDRGLNLPARAGRVAQYAYRLQLRNLAQWLHKLLHEPLDDVQRENDVTMIEQHCLDRLERVEQTAMTLDARSIDGHLCIES